MRPVIRALAAKSGGNWPSNLKRSTLLDADFNSVWVDEADLASHFGTNAARTGSPQPVAADATPLVVATVPTTHPPSAFSEWCQLGFDPVVSAALVACSASTVELATPHPLTAGEVSPIFNLGWAL